MSEKEDSSFVDKVYEIEQEEWARLSVSLRQHGLPAIDVTHPFRVSRFSDIVVMSVDMAKCARQSLAVLMRDGDRRQQLIQEMIITNNQLREELKAQTLVAIHHEDDATKLKAVISESFSGSQFQKSANESRIDVSSSRVLDASLNSRFYVTQLQAKCDQLRQKCDFYEQEVERLSAKNKRFIEEEEKRRQRENEVFEHFHKKPGKERIDDIVVNIIDSYERQIYLLRKELDGDNDTTTPSENTIPNDACTPNFKALIRAYEKKVQDLKKKLKSVEDECEMVKLELQSRPQLKDFRESQLRIKQLERMVNNFKTNRSQSFEVTSDHSSRSLISDIDFMSVSHCRQYLKLFCDGIGVVDLELVAPRLQKMVNAVDALPQLEQFAKEVLHIVNRSDLPRPHELGDNRMSNHKDHEIWCEKTWSHVIPTLEYWTLQLKNLKELQLSIKRMIDCLFPWCPVTSSDGAVTTAQLIHTIDSLIYDNPHGKYQMKGLETKTDQETRVMLHAIVTHFQKLFDVPNVMGVYARMSDIYRKLGETRNVMMALKDYLGLDESVKSSAVLNAVAELCDAQNSDSERRLTELLQVDDISGVVSKVREYQEFFTAFRNTMEQLISLLGVMSIDEIVPAVRFLTADR